MKQYKDIMEAQEDMDIICSDARFARWLHVWDICKMFGIASPSEAYIKNKGRYDEFLRQNYR